MDQPDQSVGEPTVGIGAIMACAGAYFILVGADVLPPPGDEPANAPGWVAGSAGLAFLLAGIGCISQARAAARRNIRPDGQLSEAAPRWQQAIHALVGLGVAGCLASIGTWIALGGGTRSFTVSGLLFGAASAGELIGRTVFGVGTAIVWLLVVALAVQATRKFFRPPKS